MVLMMVVSLLLVLMLVELLLLPLEVLLLLLWHRRALLLLLLPVLHLHPLPVHHGGLGLQLLHGLLLLRGRWRWHHAGGQLPYRHHRWVRRRHRLVGWRRGHGRHGKLGLAGLVGRGRRGWEGAPWRRREAVWHADHVDDGGVVGRQPNRDN